MTDRTPPPIRRLAAACAVACGLAACGGEAVAQAPQLRAEWRVHAPADAASLNPGPAAWLAGGNYYHAPGGRRVFFRRGGVRGRPVLLALHGFPTSSYDWHAVWPGLTARFDVVAPDLLGHGFSDKPKRRPYSVFEQADLVQGLLTALGVREAHVLSHDYGDTITQELLARSREGRPGAVRVESVAFANGGLFLKAQNLTAIHRLFRSPLGVPAEPVVVRPLFDAVMKSLFAPDARRAEAELPDLWQLLKRDGGKFVLHDVIQYLDERDRYEARWGGALATTSAPLALIYGPLDRVSGETVAREFAKVAPTGRLVRLDGTGHYPHLEAPGRFFRAFDAFHDGIGTPR